MENASTVIIQLLACGNNNLCKYKIMKKILCCFIVIFAVNSCKAEKINYNSSDSDSTRQPVFAGQFYVADPTLLTTQIKVFMGNAVPSKGDSIIAIIGLVLAGWYNCSTCRLHLFGSN